MWTAGVVQWGIHMEFSRQISLGACVYNGKCMCTSAYGDIVDCIEFI